MGDTQSKRDNDVLMQGDGVGQLRVISGSPAWVPATSEAGGKADEIGVKADIGVRKHAFCQKAVGDE
jgi:hypothetical protein